MKEGGSEDQDGYEAKDELDSTSVIRKAIQFPIAIIQFFISFISNTFFDSSLGILIRFDSKFLYILAYLLSSLFGVFYSQTIFLFYILFFFMENDHLSNVFNAIAYNLSPLFSVGLLGVVFMYVFCLVFF